MTQHPPAPHPAVAVNAKPTARRARRVMRRAARMLWALCGYAVIYIAVFGLLGFFLHRPPAPVRIFGWQRPADCYPHLALFFTLQSYCAHPWADALWFLVVGLPRAMLALPAVAIACLIDAWRNGAGRDWGNTGALWIFALPALALESVGLLRWARQWWVWAPVGLVLAGEIGFLAAAV